MATRAKVRLPAVKLKAASALSLTNHILFFKYLSSEQFYNDFKNEFQRPEVLDRIQGLAKIIIQANIYAAYDPKKYIRTGDLVNSFSAGVDNETELANITLYSSPSVAKAKLLSDHSYAEFFDPRSEKRSFLLNVLEPEDAIRPFVNELETLIQEELPETAIRSFETVMGIKKP